MHMNQYTKYTEYKHLQACQIFSHFMTYLKTNAYFICQAVLTTSCSHTESRVQYADPIPHILPTGFYILH